MDEMILRWRMEAAGVTPQMLYELKTERKMTLKEVQQYLVLTHNFNMRPQQISQKIKEYSLNMEETSVQESIESSQKIKEYNLNTEETSVQESIESSQKIKEYNLNTEEAHVQESIESKVKKVTPKAPPAHPQLQQKSRMTEKEIGRIDEQIKDMFMIGATLRTYCQNNYLSELQERVLRKRLRQLKWVAAHQRKRGEEWIPDQDFVDVIERVENTEDMGVYRKRVKPFIDDGRCSNGAIDVMKLTVFNNNNDLMVFALLGRHLRYDQRYDGKVWQQARRTYEDKFDKYFAQLHSLEKQRQQRKQPKVPEKKHVNTQNEDNVR